MINIASNDFDSKNKLIEYIKQIISIGIKRNESINIIHLLKSNFWCN